MLLMVGDLWSEVELYIVVDRIAAVFASQGRYTQAVVENIF
jgi:hypothetical protein